MNAGMGCFIDVHESHPDAPPAVPRAIADSINSSRNVCGGEDDVYVADPDTGL